MIYKEVMDYWESKGLEFTTQHYNTGIIIYSVRDFDLSTRTVAIEYNDSYRKTIYYIGEHAFYGDEILQVLKMKAFL